MPRAGLSAPRLAEAGASLADESGLGRVTLSELARRLGVRQASLYAHVGGLDELLARVSVLALSELADRGEDALAGRAGRDALEALGAVHRAYAAEHPGRYEATLRAPSSDLPDDVVEQLVGAGRRHARMTEALLRGYDVPAREQVHAVRLVGSVLRGFVDLERAGTFAHSRPASSTSWTRIVDVVDRALRAWE